MSMMIEPNIWEKFTTYEAKNSEKAALEAELKQEELIKNANHDF